MAGNQGEMDSLQVLFHRIFLKASLLLRGIFSTSKRFCEKVVGQLAHLHSDNIVYSELMEGESNSGLFVNDGSFLGRFKQLQQQQQKEQASTQGVTTGVSLESINSFKTSLTVKKATSFKPTVKPAPAPANGKFAFSLKQKSKLAAPPVKLGGDEDDEDESEDGKRGVDRQSKRLKLEASNTAEDLQDAPQNDILFPLHFLVSPFCQIMTTSLSEYIMKGQGSYVPPGYMPAAQSDDDIHEVQILSSHEPRQDPIPWSSGICACCDDMQSCCIGFCCPCVLFGKNVEFLEGRSWTGPCLVHFLLWSVVTGICCSVTEGSLVGLLCSLVSCYACGYRKAVRAKYNLEEAPCGDLATHLFCHMCAICQEYREIHERSDGFNLSVVTAPPVLTMEAISEN